MKAMGMTDGQLRAMLEAIQIINRQSKDKDDFDRQIEKIKEALDNKKGQRPDQSPLT